MPALADYTIVIRPDDGTFVAYVPAIPGCHAVGGSPEEAQVALADVFEMIADEYRDAGRPLPQDVDGLEARAS